MLMLGKHAFVCAYMHLAALVDQKKDVIERLLKKVAKLPDNAKQFIFELVPEVGRLQNERVKQLARQSIEMQGHFHEKRPMIGNAPIWQTTGIVTDESAEMQTEKVSVNLSVAPFLSGFYWKCLFFFWSGTTLLMEGISVCATHECLYRSRFDNWCGFSM